MSVKTMAEATAAGIDIEVLFWVGCSGSFDPRAQRVTKAFSTLLEKAGLTKHPNAQYVWCQKNSNCLSALLQHTQK